MKTGYLFILMALFMVIAAPIGGSLVGRVSSRMVIFWSTIIAGCGMFLFSFLDPRSTALDIILPLCVMTFGMGFGMAQRTNIIASVVPENEIGAAFSVLALARNIAGAFKIAFFGTMLNSSIETNLLEINRWSSLNSINPAGYAEYISLMTLKAQVMAYDRVFIVVERSYVKQKNG